MTASLPKHQYVLVDSRFTHKDAIGLVPAVWFGIASIPGRVWGCHVLLENGAVYRNLPPHALAFKHVNDTTWGVEDGQLWDCYGRDFSVIEYAYLSGLEVIARVGDRNLGGRYLFTACPHGDGFSEEPSQSKEFAFLALDNGRLTIQPTNRILFIDKSFTTLPPTFPNDLKIQTEKWSCE